MGEAVGKRRKLCAGKTSVRVLGGKALGWLRRSTRLALRSWLTLLASLP